MKGPYNCSKLFGTLCRPKAVTLSSYNILIQEKHRNMCVVIGTWGGVCGVKEIFIIFQSHYSPFQTWTIHWTISMGWIRYRHHKYRAHSARLRKASYQKVSLLLSTKLVGKKAKQLKFRKGMLISPVQSWGQTPAEDWISQWFIHMFKI